MAAFIIIDDRPLARLANRMLLEKEGHIVVAEADTSDCITQRLEKYYAEALIVDIDFPGINGLDVITLLRAENINMPVIVMSGKERMTLPS